MATLNFTAKTGLGDPTPSVGGGWRKPRVLKKVPRVKAVPADDLGQYLLGMFLLHSSVKNRFSFPDETMDDVARRLTAMDDSTKKHLLARVERMLGVPHLDS